MKAAFVAGVGLWTPGFASPAAWVAGVSDGAEVEPRAALIAQRLLRRSSFLTRMSAEVLGQACAGADLARVMTVHASANGEVRTLAALLQMLRTDGIYSPIRFQNSVHNTSAGHLSIATANPCFSTSIAAGGETVAMGLLEAMSLLEDRGGEAIVIFADECPGDDFGLPAFEPLATAVHLSATPGDLRARLSGLRVETETGIASRRLPPASLADNPCANSLSLIEALQRRRPGTLALSPGPRSWVVDLHIGELSP